MSTLLNLKCTNLKVFVNTINQQVRSLKAIEIPVDQSNSILIPLFVSKLDQKLAREWQTYLKRNDLSPNDQFVKFLLNRVDIHASVHQFTSQNIITNLV